MGDGLSHFVKPRERIGVEERILVDSSAVVYHKASLVIDHEEVVAVAYAFSTACQFTTCHQLSM